MKITIAAAVILLVVSSGVRAGCLPTIEGYVQAHFRVASCRMVKAPRPDSRQLVRLTVSALNVDAVRGPNDSPELLSHYDMYVENLGKAKHLLVDAAHGSTCTDFAAGSEQHMMIETMCCDTPPHKGICRLTGPLVRPNQSFKPNRRGLA